MTSRPTWSRWVPLVGISLTVVVSVFFGVGFLAIWFMDQGRESTIVIDDPVRSETVVVSVAGAVATPGLYELPGGSRVQHALDAAGGVQPEADLAAVNPAVRVRDGEQIVVPHATVTGDTSDVAAESSSSAEPMAISSTTPGSSNAVVEPGGLATIDINSASQAELDQLPGIGPAKAGAIIAYREANGPFTSIEELADVEGISEEMVADLSPYIRIGP